LRHQLKIAILVGVLAMVAAPAAALATQPAEPGNGHKPAEPANGHKPAEPGPGQGESKGPDYSPGTPVGPGPEASLPAKAKAYGRYCQGEIKKHVAGTPGTPFSACVTAHAKAAVHTNMSPGRACKATTGKHIVGGEKGTPHSRCVAGVIKQRQEEREATS
jgi:hypothetical protein